MFSHGSGSYSPTDAFVTVFIVPLKIIATARERKLASVRDRYQRASGRARKWSGGGQASKIGKRSSPARLWQHACGQVVRFQMMLFPPGIKNCGNLCFANSILQCLLSQRIFKKAFTEFAEHHTNHCADCMPGKGSIAMILILLILFILYISL